MEEQDKNNFSWKKIDKYLQEKTESGLKLAIIEANKIFEYALKSKNFSGSSINEKILNAEKFFDNFDDLKKARKKFLKIIHKIDYSLAPEKTKEVLTAYYQATINLEEVGPRKFTALKDFFKKKTKINFKKALKKGIAAIISFFLLVLFLADTGMGNRLVEIIVNITHIFFKRVVPAGLIIIGLFIIILGSLFYLETRKRNKRLPR